MGTNLNKYRADLDRLIEAGDAMAKDLAIHAAEQVGKLDAKLADTKKEVGGSFERGYQSWYTESQAVIRQIIPDRLQEFNELYRPGGKRKEVGTATYVIQDWITGVRSGTMYNGKKFFEDISIATMKMQTQLRILCSAQSRFESSLFDIRQVVQADLFDNELDTARELLKNGFIRGAGAIAGVILEGHLGEVCQNHGVKSRKKAPSISDFNGLLKEGGVLDVPTWRFIQRLGDLRNLCDHNKDREPTADEVRELIEGVEKVTKTVY